MTMSASPLERKARNGIEVEEERRLILILSLAKKPNSSDAICG
jgi:hypothetical protein